jgi:hypothetical protein
MIFNVRRASGFPIVLEMEEQHALDVLEEQGRWSELEEMERTLRHSDSLKDIKVECEKLEELLIFMHSIGNPLSSLTINFSKKTITIEDNGREVQ